MNDTFSASGLMFKRLSSTTFETAEISSLRITQSKKQSEMNSIQFYG